MEPVAGDQHLELAIYMQRIERLKKIGVSDHDANQIAELERRRRVHKLSDIEKRRLQQLLNSDSDSD